MSARIKITGEVMDTNLELIHFTARHEERVTIGEFVIGNSENASELDSLKIIVTSELTTDSISEARRQLKIKAFDLLSTLANLTFYAS